MNVTVGEIPEPVGLYDPFVHAMVPDPYPLYRELRDEHPIYYNEERDLWAISRFEDVQQVARDWRTFANSGGADVDVGPQWFGIGDFVDSDPPRHERLRGVVKNPFSPRATAAMAEDVRRQVDELLAPMLERGHGELVREFAAVIPLVIIFDLLGYPREDVEALKPLLYAVQLRTPGATEPPETAVRARGELHAYIEAAAEERRRSPRADLLTHIVESERTGGVTPEEIPGMALLLMIAGWETSSILITNAIWLLAQHPDQRQRLRANPAEIPAAVEEVLRFEAPVQHLARLTLADATLRDRTIPEGSRVLLLWASANRDERRWEAPDRFDIGRRPQRNLGFGEGIHHCLGAPLARLEARVVLETLLARDIEFEVGEPGRLPQVIIRGISELPIRFG
jgi:cytochrome P450